MPVTLYNTYIDYNGDRTFIAVSNSYPTVNCGNIQCNVSTSLIDNGETVTLQQQNITYNCNCACDCACNC